MQGGQYKKKTSAEGKVCIVTGSNTGIGKETVRELAKRKAHVYMACRNMQKCEEVIPWTNKFQFYLNFMIPYCS